MRHGALSDRYIFVHCQQHSQRTTTKKLLLTIYVLPLVSDTVFGGRVPCIHDERRHRWHLHHHRSSSQAITLMLDISKLKFRTNTYLFLEHKFSDSLKKIIPNHYPCMSANS